MSLSKIRMRIGTGPDPIELGAREAGQIIVIFALMLTVLIGLVGIAIDTTYAWRNGLQIQRAADAAAMAGVVYLPGDLTSATNRADAIATSNGYTAGSGTSIAVAPNPSNDHQLDVTITAPVPTFFVRLFGINNWTVTRSARAAYVMPVPMGSPLAYYGVGCFVLKTGTPPPCNGTGTGDSGLTATGLGLGGLQSLGSWGAMTSAGGNSFNGDAYGPANDNGQGFSGANPLYDVNGYYYTAVLPSGGGVSIFDPGFCAMGTNGSAGNYGAGDHWVGATGTSHPVSTYYTLWNTNGQPLNQAGWTIVPGTFTGSDFQNQAGYDPNNGSAPSGATSGCDGVLPASSWHNTWWAWPGAQGLAAGTYEVQVQMMNYDTATGVATPEASDSTNGQNMFAIEATGGGSPAVYGQSRMCVYNNLADPSGTSAQRFYLGKVDQATGAGKTLEVDLFDIGDVSGNGVLKIWSPNGAGGTQTTATFNYTTDSHWHVTAAFNGDSGVGPQTGTSVTTIQTAATGVTSNFNDTWIHVFVPLPTSYGSTGLWQGGWWQIEYDISGGGASDMTTWSVNVVGNPVHLVPIG